MNIITKAVLYDLLTLYECLSFPTAFLIIIIIIIFELVQYTKQWLHLVAKLEIAHQ